MRKELYQKLFERYGQKFNEIKDESKGDSRFRDIVPNLLAYEGACMVDEGFFESKRKEIRESLHALKNYFRLIEKYPEFRKAELNETGGHFPEFGAHMEDLEINFDYEKEGFSSCKTHYISYAKKKLENKVGEGK